MIKSNQYLKGLVAILVLLAVIKGQDIYQEPKCDVELDGSLCLFNGDKVLVPRAKLPGLLLHYSFDDSQNLDLSGNGFHPAIGKPILKGQPWGGSGNSAYFYGPNFLKFNIPRDKFKASEYSIQFYIFPIQEQQMKGKAECPILQKGFDNKVDGNYERSPAIYFNKIKRSILLYFSTSDKQEYQQGEFLESNARLPYNKWAHIVVSKTGSKIKLFVNGLLDSVQVLMNFDIENDSSFYLGNTPWLSDECSLNAYIDELKILDVETKSYQVQAEASSFLAGIEPNFLHLGCINCPIETAKSACITGYHLCTNLELYSGAYTIARFMGWTELNRNIWTYNQLFRQDNEQEERVNSGIGICCLDLEEPSQM
ncbi:hypothetical protein ABPG74_010442 [Tetrahymena malaccensis]